MGALLKFSRAIDWLNAHRFGLSISIDGPKAIHDRNRLTVGGQGTYETVRRKAERLLGGANVRPTWALPPSADEVQARDDERLMADPSLTQAIGEDDPVHWDPQAAQAAGLTAQARAKLEALYVQAPSIDVLQAVNSLQSDAAERRARGLSPEEQSHRAAFQAEQLRSQANLAAQGAIVARPISDAGMDLRDIEVQALAGRHLPVAVEAFLASLREHLPAPA